MPIVVIGCGTRSSLKFNRKLKVFEPSKRAGKFLRKLFIFGLEKVLGDLHISELKNLRPNSMKNDIDRVDAHASLLSKFLV